jgi:ribonuclease P protein component
MKNQDIQYILGQKRAYKSSSFLLYIDKRSDYKTRNVAIILSKKKFRTAVLRNKIRRKIKKALQNMNISDFLYNFFIVFNVLSHSIDTISSLDLENEIKTILVKSGTIK